MKTLQTYLYFPSLVGLLLIIGCNKTEAPTIHEGISNEATKALFKNTNCVPAPDDLVSWWPFDEGSGQVANDIIDGNPGQLGSTAGVDVNDPVFTTAGKVDGALSFDGMDDFVSVPKNANLQPTKTVTVFAWVNTSDFTKQQQIFRAADNAFGNAHGYALAVFRNGSYGFGTRHSPGVNNIIATLIPGSGFHHVVGTYDGNEIRLYVDGVLQASSPETRNMLYNPTGGPIIGDSDAVQNLDPFIGVIDEVTVYNRALMASEIQTIFNAGSAGKCKKVTICHKPGTPAQKTLVIPIQALDGHLGHGDTIGPCE